MKTSISAYTPSNTDPDTRERIFVQRHELLGRIIGFCEESMVSVNKHHLLFIGPRGSGKTHLVSMAYDRLTKMPELADTMRVAWLGEDNVYTGYIDLALAIADELSEAYPEEFRFDYRKKAQSLPPDDAADVILDAVIERLGNKSILLIMENLNRAFKGLGETGLRKWRIFLQEKGRFATLSTSPQLFESVTNPKAAFYDFFDIAHLSPLDVDDARELICKIASENNNTHLVRFLDTPEGRYRLRALHHLAGGNHRMYILLSEFLTKESLDGLVASFEQLADGLTPYFQERINSLPPQQAKIVQSLCNASGALTICDIAQNTFIPETTVAKQLDNLRAKNFIISEKRGRESYYEMAEPLMRLSLEVKKQRGKPLRLAVSFLRAWFTPSSLNTDGIVDATDSTDHERYLAYQQAAIQSDGAFQQAIYQELEKEIESNISSNRFDEAMKIAEELTFSDTPAGVLLASLVLTKKGESKKALNLIKSTEALKELDSDAPPERRAIALTSRGLIYGQLGQPDNAIADYTRVIEMHDAPLTLRAEALFNRGTTYGAKGDTVEEIADYSTIINMRNAPPDQCAKALINRSVIYFRLGQTAKAIADYVNVIEIPDASADLRARALFCKGVIYDRLGQPDKAIADYTSVIEIPDASSNLHASALISRGVLHGQQGRVESAVADFSRVIEMPESAAKYRADAANWRGYLYLESTNYEASVNDFAMVAGMSDVSSYTKTFALFYLTEAMIPVRPLDNAVSAVQCAFESGDKEATCYGGRPGNLIRLILNQNHTNWPQYIEKLVPIYASAGALSTLGSGLTESIIALDKGDYSTVQLEFWNSSWQKFGAGYDELVLPLSVLDAATRVLLSGEDRSLFGLPLEIRKIVRPLLQSKLGANQPQ